MSESLRVSYTPTQDDYTRALRLFFLQWTGMRIIIGFLVVFLGLTIYRVATQGDAPNIFEVIWLLLPPVFILFIFLVQPRSIARRAVANEQLRAETTWELGEPGLEISTVFGSKHLDWVDLRKLVPTKDYYLVLLRTNRNTFLFMPRRAFATPEEQENFSQLIAAHLSKK